MDLGVLGCMVDLELFIHSSNEHVAEEPGGENLSCKIYLRVNFGNFVKIPIEVEPKVSPSELRISCWMNGICWVGGGWRWWGRGMGGW